MFITTYIEEKFKDYSDISIKFDISKKYENLAFTYRIEEEEKIPLMFDFLVRSNKNWEYILWDIIITWNIEKYFNIKKFNNIKLEQNNNTLKICFTSDCVWNNQLSTKKKFTENIVDYEPYLDKQNKELFYKNDHPFSKIIVNYVVQGNSIKIVDITIPDYKEIISPEALNDIVVEIKYEKS